jgi:GxxExxY protein
MLEFDDSSESNLVHEHTTGLIIGASFEVHQQLGYGFLERVYQRALQVELLRHGATAEIEKRIQVQYKGVVVGDYDADLIVDGCVLVNKNRRRAREENADGPKRAGERASGKFRQSRNQIRTSGHYNFVIKKTVKKT